MNSNKILAILGLLLLLILAIGSASASDADSESIGDSANIDLESNVEDIAESSDDSSILDESIDDAIAESVDDVSNSVETNDYDESSADVKNSLGSSADEDSLASTVKFKDNVYSTYFNASGNIISGKLKSGDTLDFSGVFNSRKFIINIPLIITSADKTAQLNGCSFSFISGSQGSSISNLKAKQVTTAGSSIISASGVSNITIANNDLFSNQSQSYPINLNGVSRINLFNNKVQCNAITNNTGWGQPSAITVRNSGNCNISGNTVITNDSNGIYFTGYGAASSMGTTPEDSSYGNYIFNNTVHSVRTLPSSFVYAIQLMCKDNIVLNNTIYNAFRGVSTTSSGNQIIGNIIHNIHGAYYSYATEEQGADYAIYGVSNTIIKDNIIYDSNFNNNTDSPGGAIHVGKNSIVSNNIVKNCSGVGLNVDGNNVTVVNNTMNVTGYGIFTLGNTSDIDIEENVIDSGNQSSVRLRKQAKLVFPHDIIIQNNTLYCTSTDGVIWKDDNCKNILVSNNIIIGSSGEPIVDNDTLHIINDNNFYNYFTYVGGLNNRIKENDTIVFMGSFTSKGKLSIDKKITIQGIKAVFKDTTFIIEEVDDLLFENIVIDNPNQKNADRLWGIQISKSNNVTIQNCNISINDPNSAFALYILDSKDSKILNNSLKAKGEYFVASLFVFNSTNILVNGNSISTIGPGETYLTNNKSCLNVLVQGATICPDGSIICPDGTVYGPGEYETLEDGTIICPDGTTICTDGTTICADGTQICADGTMICVDGTTICPDGTIICADGTSYAPSDYMTCADGTIVCPDGKVICVDGTTYSADECNRLENGNIICPDGTTICPDGTVICADGSSSAGVLDGVIPGTHMISGLFRAYGALFVHSSNINFTNNIVNVSSSLSPFYNLNESCNTIAGVFIHYGGFNNTISNNNITLDSNDPLVYALGIVGASSGSSAVGSKNNSFISNNVSIKSLYHGVGIYLGYKAINSTFANNYFLINAINIHDIVNRTLVEDDENIFDGNTFIEAIPHYTELVVSNVSYKWNNGNKYVSITLKDINGTAIPNQQIVITLDGKNYTGTTNANGVASIKVSISKVGTFDIAAYFNGAEYLIPSTNNGKIALTKDSTSLNSAGKTYTVTASAKTIAVTLKDGSGKAIANRKITATVNGKTFSAKTNSKGLATIKLTLTAVKTYNVAIKFAGDSYYTGSTKSVKVKVTKTKTKLSVPKKTYKKSKKVKKLTATLKDSTGKKIKGKKITFIVNKKKYTAKTNKKGVATVKVKLSKKKTYKFTVKFAGDKTYLAVKKTAKLVIK